MKAVAGRLLTDARLGAARSVRLFRMAIAHPSGRASATWRIWFVPVGVTGVAGASLVGAVQGVAPWPGAVEGAVGFGVVALLLFARLGRRSDGDFTEPGERHQPDR